MASILGCLKCCYIINYLTVYTNFLYYRAVFGPKRFQKRLNSDSSESEEEEVDKKKLKRKHADVEVPGKATDVLVEVGLHLLETRIFNFSCLFWDSRLDLSSLAGLRTLPAVVLTQCLDFFLISFRRVKKYWNQEKRKRNEVGRRVWAL